VCDTFIYRSGEQPVSKVWFGKNSDREPNEAHEVLFVKGGMHSLDSQVKCTYIEITQVSKTYDVILCKPAWMWGAEMGVNSQGVAIGNEAIFTRGKPPRDPALTGMDLLRLALERSASARNAVDCIKGLLAEYGQGGNCGYSHPFYYNNSFLIADRLETWILETIGKDWATRKYLTSTSISNGLTLHSDWDEASPEFCRLHDLAGQKTDALITTFSQAGIRRECVLSGMTRIAPDATIQEVFKLLRSHNGTGPIQTDSLTANTVCMHAGFGPIRIDQTTGSLVVDFSNDKTLLWITGTSAPCLSVFHPLLFSNFQIDTVISSEVDWQANEFFHRNTIFCPESFVNLFAKERDELEAGFIQTLSQNKSASDEKMQFAIDNCNKQRRAFIERWDEKANSEKKIGGHYFYRKAWNKFNKEANLKITL
jgi:secernin